MPLWPTAARLAAALLALSPGLPHAGEVRVLAEFPSGTFLENLVVLPDGTVLATSNFARTIERVGPDGEVSTFAELPAHPVSLIAEGDGWLVATHGLPFTEGPAFAETQGLLALDAEGAVRDEIPAPDARFLNGMTRPPGGALLVADSLAVETARTVRSGSS